MKTTNIEAKLANAISNEVPDVLGEILSMCNTQSENILEINEFKNKTKSSNWIRPLFATAAVLAFLVGGYFAIGQYQMFHTVDSVVTLDVNPSVELKINKTEIVLSATELNEDGASVLEGIQQDGEKLEGKSLDEAVNALVCSMVEKAYLSELKNAILISVDNSDNEKSIEIKTHLLTSVGDTLRKKGIDGAILVQINATNEKISELAEKYGVSKGKASLIQNIIAKTPQYCFDDLAKLNINDLSLLAENRIDEMHNITMVGTPSREGYVSSESAIDSACASSNITLNNDSEIEASLELADGKLIYNVSVITDNTKYNYYIDVKTGAILNWVSNYAGSGSKSNGQDSSADNSDNIETVFPEDPIKDIVDAITDIIVNTTNKTS